MHVILKAEFQDEKALKKRCYTALKSMIQRKLCITEKLEIH